MACQVPDVPALHGLPDRGSLPGSALLPPPVHPQTPLHAYEASIRTQQILVA